MDFQTDIIGADLEKLAQSYRYDADDFAPVYQRLQEKVAAYDPDFGPYLAGHLTRVAHDTRNFMLAIGYDSDIARKVGDAFGLHDVGKVKQDIDLWRLTVDKRDLSPEQKKERSLHTDLGVAVLEETLAELGMEPTADQQKHITLIRQLMLFHHERLDGSGPKGVAAAQTDPILRLVAIVDTVDGKTKAKGLSQIFDDMSGDKHAGQYDLRLVSLYEDYYRHSGQAAPPPAMLAKQAHSI